MASLHFPTRLCSLGLLIFLWLNAPAVFGQTAAPAAHGYDFLTLTSIESSSKNFSKLLITPAFQGKSELALEEYKGLGVEKFLDKIQRNTQVINQQLSDLTVAGWELVEVNVIPVVGVAPATTRYLFRKAKS